MSSPAQLSNGTGNPSLAMLNGSLGATEIGSVLGAFLFGIETLQTFNYYRRFPRDSLLLKTTVAVLWLLELAHTASAWHALYSQTVTFYAQPHYIDSPPRSEDATVLFAAFIYTIVQTFFANRLRILSGRWHITILVTCINVLRFCGSMGVFALLVHYSRVSILLEWRWLVTTALGLGLAVDIMITVSMCYYLRKLRSSESRRTRTMVDTLILWSIESTTLTSATSTMQIILFLTRTDLVWTIFFIIQTKLFSNSMLASLNGRQRFRDADSEPSESDSDLIHFITDGTSKVNMISLSLTDSDLEKSRSSKRESSARLRVTVCSQCLARCDSADSGEAPFHVLGSHPEAV